MSDTLSTGAWRRLRLTILTGVVGLALIGVAGPVQADATASHPASVRAHSQAAKVVRLAVRQQGKRYVAGATGMRAFDCSGLVYRVYKEAGAVSRIGGRRMGASGYLSWFRKRGLASRHNPRPGDLVVWMRGGHIGIYVGKGKAVSALNRRYGVRQHRISFVKGFTTYLHVRISR